LRPHFGETCSSIIPLSESYPQVWEQGCQIFLGKINQNVPNCPLITKRS
jgi:hypothetical protein